MEGVCCESQQIILFFQETMRGKEGGSREATQTWTLEKIFPSLHVRLIRVYQQSAQIAV